jgi:hypothetical protein
MDPYGSFDRFGADADDETDYTETEQY